jgi:outer membrane biosynthesis protein TonB
MRVRVYSAAPRGYARLNVIHLRPALLVLGLCALGCSKEEDPPHVTPGAPSALATTGGVTADPPPVEPPPSAAVPPTPAPPAAAPAGTGTGPKGGTAPKKKDDPNALPIPEPIKPLVPKGVPTKLPL